jgi:hypothetical protein
MDVFALRHHLVANYERFARSFTSIAAADSRNPVQFVGRGDSKYLTDRWQS